MNRSASATLITVLQTATWGRAGARLSAFNHSVTASEPNERSTSTTSVGAAACASRISSRLKALQRHSSAGSPCRMARTPSAVTGCMSHSPTWHGWSRCIAVSIKLLFLSTSGAAGHRLTSRVFDVHAPRIRVSSSLGTWRFRPHPLRRAGRRRSSPQVRSRGYRRSERGSSPSMD